MSPQSHRQLCAIFLVWAVGLYWVYQAMGPVSPPRAKALVLAQATPKPAPKAPEPEEPVMPEEFVPQDELAGFVPCPTEHTAVAKLLNFRARYDELGRLVILSAYEGSLGAIQIRQDLGPTKPVTALDFLGRHELAQKVVPSPGGLVKTLRLGEHRGFIRLSVNYLEDRIPKETQSEILCRPDAQGGLLAARLTFLPSPRSLALARNN
ncbi:MAG: hypothetical protein LBT38_10870 [Deltaproteobacteria bacterium]|jgi:hypothetical protein|nr:hypothetical protein [Deltaproteobacteria bacterium]